MKKPDFVKALLLVLPADITQELRDQLSGKKKPKEIKHFTDIKSFDDACRVCSTTEEEFNSYYDVLDLDPDTIAYEKLKIIIKAINNGWTPDWDNTVQPKYYAWFNLSSGSGFSGTDCGYEYTYSSVGSRLCFESKDKCEYATKQFADIYKEFLTINN